MPPQFTFWNFVELTSWVVGIVAGIYGIKAYYRSRTNNLDESQLNSHSRSNQPSFEAKDGYVRKVSVVRAEFAHEMTVWALVAIKWALTVVAVVLTLIMGPVWENEPHAPKVFLSIIAFDLLVAGIWKYITIWLKHNRHRFRHTED
tara:strand:- start:2294 stop:2731 length:438 start_codon:yes stop_codon:yes gene_type:complete